MKLRQVPLLLPLLLGMTACISANAQIEAPPGKLLAVGAENFYADLLSQIGGSHVRVVAILNDPALDPHEYEPTTEAAIAVSNADLVVMNGLGYDAWMSHLLTGSPRRQRTVLTASSFGAEKLGSNPHIWYDVDMMAALSRGIAQVLGERQPESRAYFAGREREFLASLAPLQRRMARFYRRYRGIAVSQTEPVFSYMLLSLGLTVPNLAFQRAIEEGSDPPPRAVIDFESLLRSHGVRALIYNDQATAPITDTMASVAHAVGIPVIGVTETEPAATTYVPWMESQLTRLSRALQGSEAPH